MAKQKPTTEVTIVTTPFTEVITKSGIEFSEAEKLAAGYQPLMAEVLEQAELLKPLDKTNPEHAKIAKRVSLDLGKICSRLTTKKGEDKSILLVKTRLIDGLFNVAESTARLTQKDADDIVDYLASIERERIAGLVTVRRTELESFGADTSYLPLEIMGDEQYARCLESAKLAFNARKEAAERAESERLEAIRQAELAEAERLRLQAERIEAERPESIRVKEELAAKEAELVKEREVAKQAADKLAKENAAKLAEQQRLAKIESDKQAAELAKQKQAADKLAKENAAKLKSEQERLEKVAAQQLAEKQKQNDRQSAMFALGLIWDGQMFHYQDINFHWTDLLCMDDDKFAKSLAGATKRMEVLKAEIADRERREKEDAESAIKELEAKKQAEETERKRLAQIEADKAEQQRLAKLAPDKDKINALYKSIQGFTIPEFQSDEAKAIGKLVQGSFSAILTLIKNESLKLK